MIHINDIISEGMQKFLVNKKAKGVPEDGSRIELSFADSEVTVPVSSVEMMANYLYVTVPKDALTEEIENAVTGISKQHRCDCSYCIGDELKGMYQGVYSSSSISDIEDGCRFTLKFSKRVL